MRTLGFRQEIRNQSTARGTERWASGCRLSISVTLWTVAHLRDRQGFWARLYGADLRVFFSQVFLKPPEAGGPKPVHQDNFYFGPADRDRVLTVWIAIDEATTENGCLFFVDGSHREAVLPHVAPPDEPFNLQLPAETAARFEMTAAPVSRGGVSFHHGNTLHQSSANGSRNPRRAVAIHF